MRSTWPSAGWIAILSIASHISTTYGRAVSQRAVRGIGVSRARSPMLSARGTAPPNSCQVQLSGGRTQNQGGAKPYVRFFYSGTQGTNSATVLDVPDCMTAGASKGSLTIRAYDGDNNAGSTWCQSFFLTEIEWAQDNDGNKVYGISLSDIYLNYGLDVTASGGSGLPAPMFKPFDPVWQISQQYRFHCQPSAKSANQKLNCWETDTKRYGSKCLIESNASLGKCLTLNGVGVVNAIAWNDCDWTWSTLNQLWDMQNVANEFSQEAHTFPGSGAAVKDGCMAPPT